MDDQDLKEVELLCEDFINKGHQYKLMGESKIYKKLSGITNSKDFTVGLILGGYLQGAHFYFLGKYSREMNDEESNIVLKIFAERAQDVMDSLFK